MHMFKKRFPTHWISKLQLRDTVHSKLERINENAYKLIRLYQVSPIYIYISHTHTHTLKTH